MTVALSGAALTRAVRRGGAMLRLGKAVAIVFGCLGVLLMYGPVAGRSVTMAWGRP